MTTLATLTTSVFSDLADPDEAVFTTLQVEDFIRSGIVEINRVAPVDDFVEIVLEADTYSYPTSIVTPTRVAVFSAAGDDVGTIPMGYDSEADGVPQWGWQHRRAGDAGIIQLPRSLVDKYVALADETDPPTVHVYGYGYRPVPALAADELGLSSDEEFAVREWAKTEGFQLLTHDRSLFAQWQGQTNNTDVSPVMMMNMAAQAKAEWSRRRGLIRVVRRV